MNATGTIDMLARAECQFNFIDAKRVWNRNSLWCLHRNDISICQYFSFLFGHWIHLALHKSYWIHSAAKTNTWNMQFHRRKRKRAERKKCVRLTMTLASTSAQLCNGNARSDELNTHECNGTGDWLQRILRTFMCHSNNSVFERMNALVAVMVWTPSNRIIWIARQ